METKITHVRVRAHVIGVRLDHPGCIVHVARVVLAGCRKLVREKDRPSAAIQRVAHHAKPVQWVWIKVVTGAVGPCGGSRRVVAIRAAVALHKVHAEASELKQT